MSDNPLEAYKENMSTIVGVGWVINILAWVIGTTISGDFVVIGMAGCAGAALIGLKKKDWYLTAASVIDIGILWSFKQDLNEIDRIMNSF